MRPFLPSGLARLRWAALVIVLVAAVGGRYSSFLAADDSTPGHEWSYIHQADAMHVEQAFDEGSLVPLWTPWVQCGAPLFAVPTKPFTYPPFVLGVGALGPICGMNLLLLAHLVLGGAGTALVLRHLGKGWLAATLGGLLFALAARPAEGFFTVPFGHGYAVAWWPFTTLAFLRTLDAPRLRSALLLGLCAALQVHAGGELALYWLACFLTVAALPLLLGRSARELAHVLGAVGVGAAVCVGLSAVTLLPALEWVAASGRGAALEPAWSLDHLFEDLHAELGHDSRFRTLAHVIALNYRDGGSLTLIVGLAVGVLAALRTRAGVAVLLGTLASLVIASGVLHDELFRLLPGYAKMRFPTRFLHVAGFGAVLLAGFGLDAVLRALGAVRGPAGPRGRPLGPWLQLAAACGLVALVLAAPNSVPELTASATERIETGRAVYAAPLADEHPRILQCRVQEQALWVAHGLESTGGALGGAGALHPRYAAWMPDENGAWHERENRFVLDALGVGFTCVRKPLEAEHLELAFGPAHLDRETSERLNELLLPRPLIYRRAGARARVSLVDGPALVVGAPADREASLRAAFAADGVRARTHAFVESSVENLARLSAEDTAGFASVVFAGRAAADEDVAAWRERAAYGHVVDTPLGAVWSAADAETDPLAARRLVPLAEARVTKGLSHLEVDLAEDLVDARGRTLVVAELMTVHRGWSATIDGAPAELFSADGLVTAVRLPEGARRVVFRYVPPGLRAGLWITAGTVLAWLAAWALAGRAAKRREEGVA